MALTEEQGSPIETFSPKFSAVRKFLCPWSEVNAHMTALLDFPGQLYPYRPQMYAYATRLSMEPFGLGTYNAGTGLFEYGADGSPGARLTVTYDTPEGGGGAGGDGVIRTETITPNVEFLTVDSKSYCWASDGMALKPNESPGVKLLGSRWSITLKNMLAVRQAYITYAGRICSSALTSTYTVPPITFGAGQVLYGGPEISGRTFITGVTLFDITLNFLVTESTSWNKFLRLIGTDKVFDSIMWRNAAGALVATNPYGDPTSFAPILA